MSEPERGLHTFSPVPPDSMLRVARDIRMMEKGFEFVANSWWRRTIINLVGGGERGIYFGGREKNR